MAAARNNLTRRAVLGAAFAMPTVLRGAETAVAAHRGAWEAALFAMRSAEAELEAYRLGPMRAANRAFNAVRRRWPIKTDFNANPVAGAEWRAAWRAHRPHEERFNDLQCAHLDAIRQLLRTPAPDLAALATKIELVVDYEVGTLEGGEDCMAALKSDASLLVAT